MPALIERVVGRRDAMIRSRRLEIVRDIAAARSIFGESFLIEQAIGNILDNAIDFAPEGSKISIKAAAVGERYEVRVEDDGPGIPEFAEDKIFDRFYSLPRPDTGKKSSGLGLTFVREIMALHSGAIRLLREGGHTVATLSFPRR